jgi:hypothetical protein
LREGRLGEVVVSTEFESDHTVNVIAGTTCQNDDRDVRTGTNFPEKIESVVLAEVQLENDRTCVPASQLTDHRRAVHRRDGLYAVFCEIVRDQVPDRRIVIHHKDAARAAAGGHNAAGLDLGQHVFRRPHGCCGPRRSTKIGTGESRRSPWRYLTQGINSEDLRPGSRVTERWISGVPLSSRAGQRAAALRSTPI